MQVHPAHHGPSPGLFLPKTLPSPFWGGSSPCFSSGARGAWTGQSRGTRFLDRGGSAEPRPPRSGQAPTGGRAAGGSIGGEGRELSRLGAQAWEPTLNAGGGTGREGPEVSRRDKKRAVKSC